MATRWGVVSTVAEPEEIVLAFVCHHLSLGASQIFIFLDRPEEFSASLLSLLPGVVVIRCDDHYWHDNHGCARPKNINRRQRMNATSAYNQASVDWLAHIDADEFLHSDQLITKRLAEIPEEVDAVTMPNIERVYLEDEQHDVFTAHFRKYKPLKRWKANAVFGEVAPLTRSGFAAYVIGKSFSRTKRQMSLGLHRPRGIAEGKIGDLNVIPFNQVSVCHFDGFTRAHWAAKMLRYIKMGWYGGGRADRARVAQVAYMKQRGNHHAAAFELHDLIKVISSEQKRILEEESLLTRADLAPHLEVGEKFPELKSHFSAEKFDQRLGILKDKLY